MKINFKFISILSCLTIFNSYALSPDIFEHRFHKDQVEVVLEGSEPTLKIWQMDYPDIPECNSGYELVYSPELITIKKIVDVEFIDENAEKTVTYLNAGLFLSSTCREALNHQSIVPRKTITQEIHLYQAMPFYLKDKTDEIIELFKKNEIKIKLKSQIRNYNGIFEDADPAYENFNLFYGIFLDRIFTYNDVLNGKILLNKDSENIDDHRLSCTGSEHFDHINGDTKIELNLVKNRPALKILNKIYPNTEECNVGYQISNIKVEKNLWNRDVINFTVAPTKECINSLHNFMPIRTLTQQVDIYSEIEKNPKLAFAKELFQTTQIQFQFEVHERYVTSDLQKRLKPYRNKKNVTFNIIDVRNKRILVDQNKSLGTDLLTEDFLNNHK